MIQLSQINVSQQSPVYVRSYIYIYICIHIHIYMTLQKLLFDSTPSHKESDDKMMRDAACVYLDLKTFHRYDDVMSALCAEGISII